MGDNVIKSLFIKLGYEYDDDSLKKFNNFLDKTRTLLKRAALAAIALGAALAVVAKQFADRALLTDRAAKAIGAETKALEGLLRVSDRVLGNRDAALNSVTKLATIQRQLRVDPASVDKTFIRGLQDLGISLEDVRSLDPTETLLRINEALLLQGESTQRDTLFLLGMTEAYQLLTRAGLRQEAVEAQNNRNTKALQEASEIIKELKDDFEDFLVGFGGEGKEPFFLVALRSFRDVHIPAIKLFLEDVKELFMEIEKIIESIAEFAAKITFSFSEKTGNSTIDFSTQALKNSVTLLDMLGTGIGGLTADLVNAVSGSSSNTVNNANNNSVLNQNVTVNATGGSELAGSIGQNIASQTKQGIERTKNGLRN